MANKMDFDSDHPKGKCPVVQVVPKGSMGLIVLQEWWGLNDQIQEEARLLVERGGFVAVVPDLYRGELAVDNEKAGHLMSNLDWEGALKDIQACAKSLKAQGCQKVGVMGFCMGGALSFAAAVRVPEIDAAAPFYGIPNDKLADVSTIKKPLQCHFAELDEVAGFSDPTAQKKVQEKLKSGGVAHEFFVYPGAKHAFTNHSSPNFNKGACESSFQRVTEFFKKHLASDQTPQAKK